MAVQTDKLRIVHYPAEVLRRRAEAVDPADPAVHAVGRRMVELMHQARGVGLAAPQVGLSWRLFVANPSGEPGDDLVFINPTITPLGAETASAEEGCLSIPDVNVEVRRPVSVRVSATGLDGRVFELTSDDLPARVWQHETDHLDGVLIIDRMTPMDRVANRRVLRDLEAAAGG